MLLEYCLANCNADFNETFLISDVIGLLGVALLVITYGLLQTDKIDPKGFWYSFNNLLVAIIVTVSLIVKFNPASMVIEVFWFLISLYGVIMYFKGKSQQFELDPKHNPDLGSGKFDKQRVVYRSEDNT